MKKRIMEIWQKLKKWLFDHKKLFQRIGIALFVLVGITGLSIVGFYFYVQHTCPKEIVLEDAFYDITALDLSFSERDLEQEHDANGARYITATGGSVQTEGEGVACTDGVITVTAPGTYIFSGETEGMLLVDAGAEDKVQLVFRQFTLSNPRGPAVYIRSADKVFLTTAENTVNTLSDGSQYAYTDGDTNVDGAVFSKADLTLNGSGTLKISGKAAHGIVSKDDLVVGSGTYEITGAKKAVNGKDCVKIHDCQMTLQAGTDGISSDNAEDADRGFVYIQGGNIRITCNHDGVQAENVLILDAPVMEILSGGGSANAPQKESDKARGRKERETEPEEVTTESMKGLKSAKDILINGGDYTIDSCDDSIHADHSVKIADGTFQIKSGDDGIHGEHTLQILDGKLTVQNSFEGLEAWQIAISGGEISVTASDDGINAASDSTAIGGLKGLFAIQALGKMEITGGHLTVDSQGDSLDSNGVMTLSGGTVLVSGPAGGGAGDGIVDCDGSKTVNGAILLCTGSTGKSRGSGSGDYFEPENQIQVVKSVAAQPAGTALQLQDSTGKVIATFTVPKEFSQIVASAPGLSQESDYIFLLDGEKQE